MLYGACPGGASGADLDRSLQRPGQDQVWRADLDDALILENLVAINAERLKEGTAGFVRWLRPGYQIPRFTRGGAARTGELDFGEVPEPLAAGLPPFPTGPLEQPLAVEALLRAAARPMSTAEIAHAFRRGGKRIEARVGHVLTMLALYGQIIILETGRYAARKAA